MSESTATRADQGEPTAQPGAFSRPPSESETRSEVRIRWPLSTAHDGHRSQPLLQQARPTTDTAFQASSASTSRSSSRAEAVLSDPAPTATHAAPAPGLQHPPAAQSGGDGDDYGGDSPRSLHGYGRIESVFSGGVDAGGALQSVAPGALPGAIGGAGSSYTSPSRNSGSRGEPMEGGASSVATAAAASPPLKRLTDLLFATPEMVDDMDEEAELSELSQSKKFEAEQDRDPRFMLLHFVALLGHGTLAGALRSPGGHREHRRFARLARCLVARRQHKVYVMDKYGCTPLQLAAACGNVEMVKVLLEPYDFAATGQHVLSQIENGYAYLNHQDDQIRFSALHSAVSHSQNEVVVLLLKHGADPQVLDVTRCTAFKVAPSLASLQRLLKLVVRHESQVPRPVIVQLMAELLDSQNRFQATQMWSKAMTYVSFKTGDESKRFSAVASELMGAGHGADASAIIKRYFQQLNQQDRSDVVLYFVSESIKGNHAKLTEVMINLICDECPEVLAAPKWQGLLESLVCSFPALFHRLLSKLQDMRDQDIRSFVRCLIPAKLEANEDLRLLSALPVSVSTSQRGSFRVGAHAADRVKLLIYQQLVEGLRKVSYRVVKTFFEESDQRLLNDMAQFPIFAEFVGLVADKETSKAFDESDSSRQLLLEFLRPGSAPTAPPTPLPGSTPRPRPAWPESEGGGAGAHGSSGAGGTNGLGCTAVYGNVVHGWDPGDQWTRRSLQTLNVRRVLLAAIRAGKADNVEAAIASIVGWVETNSKDNMAIFLAGVSAQLVQDLAMRFPSACAMLLNLVSRDVLGQLTTLQVSAGVLYNKEHLIKCSRIHNHFTWREQELRKLRTVEGYNDHIVDALVDYGVPFECIYKAAVEMGTAPGQCATPEQFAKLIEHKFSGPELKLLISNGVRLSRVIGYIDECANALPAGVTHEFREKLDVPMSVLIRNMLQERLDPRIVDVILREGKMFETTRYNNFRPGCPLREVYPEPLFLPKYTYHFVQMLLINWQRYATNSHGKVVAKPWSKDFIDTIFEPNDPLCTKLKSAYDSKLTDTHVYIQGDSEADGADPSQPSIEVRQHREAQDRQRAEQEREEEHRQQLRHVRSLLRIFISNPFLLHRWPVYALSQLLLLLYSAGHAYWQRLDDAFNRWKAGLGHRARPANKAQLGTIDAAVLVFPLLGFFHLGSDDMLTALVDADAPSSWFHFPIVRALYGVHWSMFGRVMIFLSAAVQLQFSIVFLVFFLLVLNYRPSDDQDHQDDQDSHRLATIPAIETMLCVAAALSVSMLIERVLESPVPQLAAWVRMGRFLELACHAMVWTVAGIVWSGHAANLVPALSGLTMLMLVARLTLFGLVTEKLSTAVLALMEILSDSRYFFFLIATVYAGFALAVAGLRGDGQRGPTVYSSRLFTVLLGDFPSSQLTDEREFWRYADISLILLSIYGVIMLIIFMNLLIATMNDTYDRVKEFCEVEVMRLRSHMMVFVKDFMARHVGLLKLEALDGDVLHLLLRPEAVKSSRLLPLSESDPGERSAWVGRITYMRASIVREVEDVVRQHADTQLAAIQQRLSQVEEGMASLAAEQHATLGLRLDRLEEQAAAAAAGTEQLAAVVQQLERMAQGTGTLRLRQSTAGT